MNVWEGVFLALTQIRTEKLKSFFSLLGVIIGVMFLLVVVSVVEGMDRYIKEDFASQIFGLNTITISRNPSVQVNTDGEQWRRWARRRRLTFDDAEIIRQGLTIPALVGVESDTGGELEGDNGRKVENVRISGVSPELLRIRSLEVERGRPFSAQEAERGVPVVILGKNTAETVFQGLDPVGRTVRIRGFPYRVVGVLEEQGSIFGFSLDNRVIAPARSPIQNVVNPRGIVDNIVVQTTDPKEIRPAMMEIEAILRVQNGLRPAEPNDFELETAEDSLGFWDRISTILFMALPGLVGISLVVGGIVIMNIMLVSVMERTREIGVQKGHRSPSAGHRGPGSHRVCHPLRRWGGPGGSGRRGSDLAGSSHLASANRRGAPVGHHGCGPGCGGGDDRGGLSCRQGRQTRSRGRTPL